MSKVFITRNLEKNNLFRKELKVHSFKVIGKSLVDFSPTPFSDIPLVDWLFFYSKNGVKFFFENSPQNFPKNIKWAVFGKGTATALQRQNLEPNFVGNGQPKATAKAFLEIAKNQIVLFARAKSSKKSIQKLLKGKLEMLDLVVYENLIKTHFAIPFCEYLVFTSPLNAITYFQKYKLKKQQKVIAIGKTTATALELLGIKKVFIASNPSEQALVEEIINLYNS